MKKMLICILPIQLFLFAFFTGCNSGDSQFTDSWNQYRGPGGSGVSASTTVIKPWPADGAPAPVWKQHIGDGFSGISMAGNQLVVAFGEDSSEFLAAYNRINGKEKWRCNIGKLFTEEFGDGPRSTPIIDDDRIYIYNSWGELFSVNLQTGLINWQAALADSFKIKMIPPGRGFTTSPVIIDDRIIIYTSGDDSTAFMGLNKFTGELLWRNLSTQGSYSSPILVELNNIKQVLFTTSRIVTVDGRRKGLYEVMSLTPAGQLLWKGPGLPGIIAMPVFVPPNRIFISSQMEIGSKLIEVNYAGGEYKINEVWKTKNMRNHFNSAVYFKGYIYGFSNATLECLDAKTGERKWRKRGLGKGSLIIADNKLVILSDKGKLVLAEATGESYSELAKANVIKGKSWTCPTFADGKVYLRNRKEMACYDLTK